MIKLARYLLAAEADKIQDLIFRSSRLREVVGASQLLTRFCKMVPDSLIDAETEIIISDGGSFRILFKNENTAKIFGEYLCEIYRLATGGTLTVAEPVKIPEPFDDNFIAASKLAEENLRQAKRKNKGWCGNEQMPYMAICTSCGLGLANVYSKEEGKQQYICSSCLNKNAETKQGKNKSFLEKFYKVIAEKDNATLDEYSWPGKDRKDPTEEVADYDQNRYVAYIAADGNSMGEVFGKCNRKQMEKLSNGLEQAICRALAEPTRLIMENNQRDGAIPPKFIPVLPLILGGDDLFALIPAPWALNFASSFCQAFEREIKNIYKDIELDDIPPSTISAAVVICKNKHPYTLAYTAAAASLKKAKQLHRKVASENEEYYHSVVNFEVIVGGRLTTKSSSSDFQATLKPYFIRENNINDGWGLPLQKIIEQRWNLRHLPSKRLHELQNIYDPSSNNLPSSMYENEDRVAWRKRLDGLLKRIERRNENQGKAVNEALSALGGIDGWYGINRPYEKKLWQGHGLPDLLDTWDFALDLEKPARDYEED